MVPGSRRLPKGVGGDAPAGPDRRGPGAIMSTRRCQARAASGEPCRAHPLRDHAYCFTHSPEHAEQAQQSRRRGGRNRRRKSPGTDFSDLGDLAMADRLRRLYEIAVSDTLEQENSLQRNHLLVSAIRTGIQLAAFTDESEQIASLERAVLPRIGGT